jgi:hypothetical protein
MTHAGRDLRAVALDLHAPAATMAELAPREVCVDARLVKLQPGWQPLDDAGQTRAM